MNRLNKPELVTGVSAGIVIGVWTNEVPLFVFAVCLSPFLWAMGGAGNKKWRRLGIPTLAAVLLFLSNGLRIELAFIWAALFGVCALGYGIPTRQVLGDTDMRLVYIDDGSALGRFFYNLFGEHEKRAHVATRGMCGAAFGLSFVPAALMTGLWWNLILNTAFCAVLFAFAEDL